MKSMKSMKKTEESFEIEYIAKDNNKMFAIKSLVALVVKTSFFFGSLMGLTINNLSRSSISHFMNRLFL